MITARTVEYSEAGDLAKTIKINCVLYLSRIIWPTVSKFRDHLIFLSVVCEKIDLRYPWLY